MRHDFEPYLDELRRLDTEYVAGRMNFEERERQRADCLWRLVQEVESRTIEVLDPQ